MVTTLTSASNPDAIAPLAEQRVTLYNLSWSAYEQIQAALGENRAARLTYDRGALEIMVPLEPHEGSNRLIERFIVILVAELGLTLKTMGSTALKYPDLETSPEPDSCYYIQHEPLVRGRLVDFTQDPPPDLVLEVDITHTNIDKEAMYARLGVPEFWRYNGKALRILRLEAGTYTEVEASPTFPQWVQKTTLYEFLGWCQTQGEVAAEQRLRAWVRESLR
jgi:Uma2 family endonuclease